MFKQLFFVMLALLWIGPSVAAEDVKQANAGSELSVEEAMLAEIPVVVASRTAQTVTKAPGIVTVITREEISNSGARNLDDLLALVPGFATAMDVEGMNGYGIRGLWSWEGKLLVMVDGVQMNELLYGNHPFGGQFFTHYIDHIEIIRGPGSALYGGFGELAVINIITRGTAQKGGSVEATYGQMLSTFGRRQLNVNFGNRYEEVGISFTGAFGDGHFGDNDFVQITDQVFPMKDYSGQKAWLANLGLDYQNLFVRILASNFAQDSTMYGSDADGNLLFSPWTPLTAEFMVAAGEAKYIWHPLDHLTVTPQFTFTRFESWKVTSDISRDPLLLYYQDNPQHESKANLIASYDFSQEISCTLGGEYRRDVATSDESTPFINGLVLDYYTLSAFGEALVKTPYVDVTVGARYDKHNLFGGAFVPRFALVKEIGDFHVKGLAARAYRAPTFFNLDTNPNLNPEYTTSYEIEVGYKLMKNMTITLNAFDLDVKDIIVYSNEPGTNNQKYLNSDESGSRGLEAEVRLREAWGYATAGYSFYRAYNNNVPLDVPLDDQGNAVNDVYLGLPAHKLTANANWKIWEGISLNPSLIWLSKRYALYYDNTLGANASQVLDPVLLAHLYLRTLWLGDKLEIGLGVYNLTNTGYVIATGYSTNYRPTPGPSRELMLKLAYSF